MPHATSCGEGGLAPLLLVLLAPLRSFFLRLWAAVPPSRQCFLPLPLLPFPSLRSFFRFFSCSPPQPHSQGIRACGSSYPAPPPPSPTTPPLISSSMPHATSCGEGGLAPLLLVLLAPLRSFFFRLWAPVPPSHRCFLPLPLLPFPSLCC
ncbi:hypothetical protein B484DRAFT_459105 [Ochromonadaceae sp. CCMP2298]|nr:hypothetical protein B484DRAFT_459105 [Ochromonadaceae sp. CCMP2298]